MSKREKSRNLLIVAFIFLILPLTVLAVFRSQILRPDASNDNNDIELLLSPTTLIYNWPFDTKVDGWSYSNYNSPTPKINNSSLYFPGQLNPLKVGADVGTSAYVLNTTLDSKLRTLLGFKNGKYTADFKAIAISIETSVKANWVSLLGNSDPQTLGPTHILQRMVTQFSNSTTSDVDSGSGFTVKIEKVGNNTLSAPEVVADKTYNHTFKFTISKSQLNTFAPLRSIRLLLNQVDPKQTLTNVSQDKLSDFRIKSIKLEIIK